MDVEEFRVRGKEMVEYICDYVRTLEGKRVTANVEPGYLRPQLPNEAPIKPESFDAIMRDVEAKIMPGITHWQHPRFHAYFPSGNSFPSILGDMLSDALGSIGFSWAASPACTELESIVLDWYAKAIGLPDAFLYQPQQQQPQTDGQLNNNNSNSNSSSGGGVIQGSASECVLVCMLAARAQAIRALQEREGPGEDSSFLPRLVAYCSTEAHSCVEKAAMICLVKLRVLQPDEACRLRGATLQQAIEADVEAGYVPFFVSTTLGTTGSCAFDDLSEIGLVCQRFPGAWLHVDAAYAGSSFICPEQRPLMAGLEYADSFNTNPNKWLLVNFDCSCLWVRDRFKLTSALVVDPLYLQHANSAESIDYRHWGIPLSRRFRALKLWFVMRSYGISGLQAYIRNHISLAQRFAARMRRDRRFELLNAGGEVRSGLVCFRLRQPTTSTGAGGAGDEEALNQELLANINASGRLHMIPARVRGRYALRFCVVHEHATANDVDWALECIREHAAELLLQVSEAAEAAEEDAGLVAKSPKQLDRKLVRKFSFTRAVSRDAYKRSRSKTNLHDGATPIMVVERDDNKGGNSLTSGSTTNAAAAVDTIDEDPVFSDSESR